MRQLKPDTESTRAIRPIKLVPESVRRLRRPQLRVPLIRQSTPTEAQSENARL
jgi:hypothetical protein